MVKYECPECSSMEDEQYCCTTCWGSKELTQEEVDNLVLSGCSIDDFTEIKEGGETW